MLRSGSPGYDGDGFPMDLPGESVYPLGNCSPEHGFTIMQTRSMGELCDSGGKMASVVASQDTTKMAFL